MIFSMLVIISADANSGVKSVISLSTQCPTILQYYIFISTVQSQLGL